MRRVVLLAIVLVAICAQPAAAARWQAPLTITTRVGGTPQLAVDARGDRALVWFERGIRVATATPDGEWTRARLVRGTDDAPQDLRLAIGPRGELLIAWTYDDGTFAGDALNPSCCIGTRAVVIDRARRIGRITTMTPRGTIATLRDLDIDTADRFAVAYNEGESGLGGTGVRSAAGQRRFGPAADVDGTGKVVAIDEQKHSTLLFRLRDAGSSELTDVRVARDGATGREGVLARRQSNPIVRADDRGGAVAVLTGYGPVWPLDTATRSDGGRFDVRELPGFGSGQGEPVLAVAPSGGALLAQVTQSGLDAAVRAPGKPFGPGTTPVAADGALLDGLATAVSDDGTGVLVWTSMKPGDQRHLEVALLDRRGRIRTRQRLDGQRSGESPAVGIDAHGRATAAWLGPWGLRVADYR